jgi:hypothetical protein
MPWWVFQVNNSSAAPEYGEGIGFCNWQTCGAIQMVTDDIQDVRRECRVYAFGGGVCVGVAGLWIGRRILGKFFLPGV